MLINSCAHDTLFKKEKQDSTQEKFKGVNIEQGSKDVSETSPFFPYIRAQ